MAKSAKVRAAISINDEDTASLSVNPTWRGIIDQTISLVEGTDAGEFDLAYADERTVSTGANDDIDLAGVLTDAFGNTITAVEIVALVVVNKQKDGTANTTDLTLGNEGTNTWTGLFGASGTVGPLKPGAMFLAAAGDAAGIGAVVAGTGDILRIANSAGASATYQIAILARSA